MPPPVPSPTGHWLLPSLSAGERALPVGCGRAVCDLGGGRSTPSGQVGTDSANMVTEVTSTLEWLLICSYSERPERLTRDATLENAASALPVRTAAWLSGRAHRRPHFASLQSEDPCRTSRYHVTTPSSFLDVPPATACVLTGDEGDAVSLTPLSSLLGSPCPRWGPGGGPNSTSVPTARDHGSAAQTSAQLTTRRRLHGHCWPRPLAPRQMASRGAHRDPPWGAAPLCAILPAKPQGPPGDGVHAQPQAVAQERARTRAVASAAASGNVSFSS